MPGKETEAPGTTAEGRKEEAGGRGRAEGRSRAGQAAARLPRRGFLLLLALRRGVEKASGSPRLINRFEGLSADFASVAK